MQRETVILFAGFTILSSCAVFNKSGLEKNLGENINSNVIRLEIIKKQNITSRSFLISKAEVEMSGKEGNERVICSIKYVFPGTYLISVRNRTGIEGARLFISNDTVLVNDRINRKLFYGSSKQLLEKFDFNQSIISLILGDYLAEDSTEADSENCKNGYIEKQIFLNGSTINYTIDCKISKVVAATIGNDNEIKLKFSKFFRHDKILVPGEVEIENIGRMTKIFIKIENIEYPWNGSIEFIPGSKYERIPLL